MTTELTDPTRNAEGTVTTKAPRKARAPKAAKPTAEATRLEAEALVAATVIPDAAALVAKVAEVATAVDQNLEFLLTTRNKLDDLRKRITAALIAHRSLKGQLRFALAEPTADAAAA